MNCGHCCEDFVIDPAHLLFPERMNEIGQAFVRTHGIDYVALGTLRQGAVVEPGTPGHVRIKHRCQWLTDENLCSIYEQRPQICRDFDCATRADCCRQQEVDGSCLLDSAS